MAASSVVTTLHPYRDIIEQFVDEASFLWVLRSVALKQPHYLPNDIAELERRIESNLNGLFTSPEEVWEICQRALEFEEAGEIFTATVFAFRSLEVARIQMVVEVGLRNDETFKGLVSAISWLPASIREPWLEKFLRSKDLDHKYLAISILGAIRQDPGDYLATLLRRDDCLANEKLNARCMRLIGELKRKDLLPVLNSAMETESDLVSFWARWSSILLGNSAEVKKLEPLVIDSGPFQEQASAMFFRTAPVEYARSLISNLAKGSENVRTVVKACAALGDPQVIPWLLNIMEQPEHSRAAAETFTHITGIHLEENNLAIDVPEIQEIPNDDPDDDNVDMDEDENLPWPDTEKLKAVWQKYGNNYGAGMRYFLGKSISSEFLRQQIVNGYQRHRYAASLELALHEPMSPLVNIDAKVS